MARPSRKKQSVAALSAKSDDASVRIADASLPAAAESEITSQQRRSAPTLPFRYFKLAIARLKASGDLPHRIDRTAWSSKHFRASGAEIVPAFQFLRLIDDDDRPREILARTIAAWGTESWPELLAEILREAYAGLLSIGIEKVTPMDALELFRNHYGLDSTRARMAVAFFLHATREAALNVGPFLSTNAKLPSPRPQTTADRTRASLLAKLPPFDETWSDELKLAWFSAFNEILSAQKLDAKEG